MKNRRVIVIAGLLVLLILIPVAIKLSTGREPVTPMAEAKVTPLANDKASAETSRSTATHKESTEPAKPRLTPDELRRSVLEQAQKTLAGNLGGLDPDSRSELEKRMTAADLRTLQDGGLSHAHPMAFTGLARLAVYLDRLSAFKQVEAEELMLGYLDKRIKELESSDSSDASGFLDRWHRELSRADGYEAVMIMGLEGRDKASLIGALKSRRGYLAPAP